MQPGERPAFKSLLTDALAFYRRDVSTFALSVWWAACQPFDLEQVRKALTAHAMDPERGRFPPMPADIVLHLKGTHSDRALVAWGKVYEAIQRVGGYQSVVFDDGAIHAAIEDIGGWIAVCRSPEDELSHLQRRFCDSYRVRSRQADTKFAPVLIGAHELENRLAGKRTAPPILIGDPHQARLVMLDGVETTRTPMQALDAAPALKRLTAEPAA